MKFPKFSWTSPKGGTIERCEKCGTLTVQKGLGVTDVVWKWYGQVWALILIGTLLIGDDTLVGGLTPLMLYVGTSMVLVSMCLGSYIYFKFHTGGKFWWLIFWGMITGNVALTVFTLLLGSDVGFYISLSVSVISLIGFLWAYLRRGRMKASTLVKESETLLQVT